MILIVLKITLVGFLTMPALILFPRVLLWLKGMFLIFDIGDAGLIYPSCVGSYS